MASSGGIFQMIQEGGIFALLVVVLGIFANLIALGVVVAAFIANKKSIVFALAGVSLMFALLLVGVGGVGTMLGNAKVDEVLPMVQAEDRAIIAEAGYAEAAIPLRFGFIFGAFPLLAGIIAAGIGATKKST